MKEINAVLFDLDGTMVDSNQILIDSFSHTFNHFFPKIAYTYDDYIHMIGPTLEETFSKLEKDTEKVQNMIRFFREYYKTNEYASITIYPNLIDTLKALKEMGIQSGIVTTKFKESALPSIDYFELHKYIDVYVYLDDIKNPKPDAEPIHYAISHLKNPKQMIIIGDNPSDIYAGKNANILTCGVEWSLKKKQLKSANPDFWLTDFNQLIPIINKYNMGVLK
ncbi:MAG: HAD-IA family hydrolase [Tenericutes bacterium]|jgi:pyrophosphatase PpaX|nr:HAD-IA family hydrolase [Mycoplasmatota bacterium]